MSDLRLSWMRDDEGVVVVYATDNRGRVVSVADFWTGPLREIGVSNARAKAIQQQLAETLVMNWNGIGAEMEREGEG